MGYSECSSSVDSSAISVASGESRSNLNLKATELRLGLPAFQSPERDAEFGLLSSSKIDEKPLFPVHPLRDSTSFSQKSIISGNKRGFSDALTGFSERNFVSNSNVNVVLSPRTSSNLAVNSDPLKENPGVLTANTNEVASPNAIRGKPFDSQISGQNMNASDHSSVPAPKAQVIGWPPIGSFRKTSLTSTTKNTGEVGKIAVAGALFVKVSMDGAPYLRKVNLKAYTMYQELSSALETMFSCFTIRQCTFLMTTGRETLIESKLKDLVLGSEYVLTYEDKDGDWMLVGDVPWEMFIDTCKRLRIMKSSNVIGLAPIVIDKCRSRGRS